MNELLKIARFEGHYHLRRPATYLFAGLILGQGCWQAIQSYQQNDLTTSLYFALASPGVILAVVIVLLAGQSLTKDHEFRTAGYLYTLPITSRSYLAGRFLGTLFTALSLSLCCGLGVMLVFLYQTPVQSFPWLALLDGFIWSIPENVFILVSLVFSLTVFMRGIQGAYIILFLVILYFLLTETQIQGLVDTDFWQLIDPFGVGMIRESITTAPLLDDPDTLPAFSDILLINRLLWLGLSVGLLAQAEATFSFQQFGQPRQRRRRFATAFLDKAPGTTCLSIHRLFSVQTRTRLILRSTRLDVLAMLRQPFFLIIVGLLIMLTVLLAMVFGQNENFPALPITSTMTALRLPMGVFISLFLLVMTVESLFQGRTLGIWPILDTLPQPAFVGISAKLLALSIIALLLTMTLFLTGIAIQLSAGFWEIDWSLYALDLTMDGFLRYCQLIALGAFVAMLVNNRIMAHVITLLVFTLLWSAYQFGPVQLKPYLYSFLPGSNHYSDLIGYNAIGPVRRLTHLLWWCVAGSFGLLAVAGWNRGLTADFTIRIQQGWQRVNWPFRFTLLMLISGFLGCIGQLNQPETERYNAPPSAMHTQLGSVVSTTGKLITIKVLFHDAYQVSHIMKAAQVSLRQGEQLFGAYPQAALQIVEVPDGPTPVRSTAGSVFLSEKEGWTADYRQPAALDYIDYLIAREVFNQWLTHRMHPVRQPGDGFLRRSLAEYLALDLIGKQYGLERLKLRLKQRTALYTASRNRAVKPETTVLQSSGNDAIERGRAALILASIGQVWSDTALSRTIGSFYHLAVQQPTSATASAFASHLSQQLPDSLRYLTTYLSDRPWFDFSIGRVANLENGLSVEITPKKWHYDDYGHRHRQLINDLIPLIVLDQHGKQIYRTLVRPEPDERWMHLPALPTAASILLDPLETWPETAKYDNHKIF